MDPLHSGVRSCALDFDLVWDGSAVAVDILYLLLHYALDDERENREDR